MSGVQQDRVCIGQLEFVPATGVVDLDGREVLLTGLPLRILTELASEPGAVVRRDDLKRKLWPQCGKIDVERRLNTAIRALRGALDDNADCPRYIETIRGCGYRLVIDDRSRQPANWRTQLVMAAASVALAMVTTVLVGSTPDSSATKGQPWDTAMQQAYLDRIVVLDGEPLRLYLDQVLKAHPDFLPARQLRARLLVEAWRGGGGSRVAANQAAIDLRTLLENHADDTDSLALLGELALYADWDWRGAEQLLRRALRIDPWHAHANQVLAWLHVYAGDDGLAAAQMVRSLSRPDLTADQKSGFGWMYLRMGEIDSARTLCTAILDEQPNHYNALECAHRASADSGDFESARHYGLRLMHSVDADEADVVTIANLSAEAGYAAYLDWSQRYFWDSDGHWFYRAMRAATAGDRDAALDALVEARRARDPLLIRLFRTTEFESLRSDPRYQRVAAAVAP